MSKVQTQKLNIFPMTLAPINANSNIGINVIDNWVFLPTWFSQEF